MKQSHLFTKTRFEAPKDEVSKNAELLIRAGFIHKDMAGVYSYLPLGLRVMNKLSGIIREEMYALGANEVSLAALQNKELWEKTGRWSDDVVDNWFKTEFKNGSEAGLGFSHEEPLTNLLKDHIRSYKDLPVSVFQIQTKFRNEVRAKSGILRGREFLMKDLYSFARDQKEHDEFYEKAKEAYVKIYNRAGIGEKTHLTFASGGVFSKYSHEFQTETEAGEDTIHFDAKKNIAINKEVFTDDVLESLGVDKKNLVEKKAIEVGNIFTLGTRFSEPLGLTYTDEKGEVHPMIMGCYGIGVGRLMGTIVEVLGEEDAMVWPDEVSPFKVHLISIANGDADVEKDAKEAYEKLKQAGIEVLFDDRELRAGEKFADADLIGIPHRIVMSKKTREAGTVEYQDRKKKETKNIGIDEVIETLA